ncbi:ATP synthase F1 subunit delta [Oenococcus oeni]|uniref:ATP synthase subunit delta n=10 Tax=Oenococcus oeni TaxID=1247 RepID=ATPD_OENOB|nr:ATP synthase F1 subunit delta [Oenococcus oeni]Q04G23.1 RecName: Full=ATP synthase subunit delta; AltName: Full=ATP synthase F(1) sector subunit delta; AltName: Full=F-type ATPase subunit delta; Short=F-ATPase subunit delta [Oenococcus oeni PSU-1]EAV40029.1 ATP synthase, delta subunit [Oenococcus oeni ATCC BAA-1163]KGO16547.1 ATP synthase subunit delta [Oenococcus oeni X2L]ABJ56599.1 ATP synthase F1 subcomplex delta subunit [Oenococcus oeni PSU-1]AVI93860.1 ATP synthase subunit delta [Oenoc
MAFNENRVINNYAEALMEVSGKQTAKVLSELQVIELVFERNKELAQTLDDVSVSSQQQEAFIGILGKGCSTTTKNFLETLADNRHFSLLEEIVENLDQRVSASNNHSLVIAKTAIPITAEQSKRLSKIAQKKFGYQHVEVKNVVDPNVIAGVILTAGSKTIDGSIKNKLVQLNNHIKQAVGKE